jgi:5'-3' exonuclease
MFLAQFIGGCATLAARPLAPSPKRVPDFIALRGDPFENLPGAPGVGPAGAATLIRQYGSLEALLRARRFPKQAAELRPYKSIATMDRKAPRPKIARPGADLAQGRGAGARLAA